MKSMHFGIRLFKPQLCHLQPWNPGPTCPRPLCLSFLLYKTQVTEPSSQGAAVNMERTHKACGQGPAQAGAEQCSRPQRSPGLCSAHTARPLSVLGHSSQDTLRLAG